MRLIFFWRRWWEDKTGVVLAFSALVLPLILLFGVIVLQSGQLYIRQAELQFMVRQAVNSGLISLAQLLKAQAETNYQTQCAVEFPPSICGSKLWSDFLSPAEAQVFAQQPSTVALVNTEIRNFLHTVDSQSKQTLWEVQIIFPDPVAQSDRIMARVSLTESQTEWIGNVLSLENYFLKVEALSYLNLSS